MKYLGLLLILFGSVTLEAQNSPLPANARTREADALLTRYVKDADGNTFNVPRATFLTNIVEGFAGVSPNARVNVGLILTLRSSLISSADTEQPALDALRYGNDERFARSGLAYTAPSVRITPFRSLPRLSFQSSFQFPAFDEESINGVFFAERSYIFANKVYYDHSFGNGGRQASACSGSSTRSAQWLLKTAPCFRSGLISTSWVIWLCASSGGLVPCNKSFLAQIH